MQRAPFEGSQPHVCVAAVGVECGADGSAFVGSLQWVGPALGAHRCLRNGGLLGAVMTHYEVPTGGPWERAARGPVMAHKVPPPPSDVLERPYTVGGGGGTSLSPPLLL